jgi:tetratricopeptide (TPR) repeat protein
MEVPIMPTELNLEGNAMLEKFISKSEEYYQHELYDQAIEKANAALRFDPQNATAFYQRGKSYMKKAEFEQAVYDFSEALETRPAFIMARTGRRISLRKFSDVRPEKMASLFEALLERHPRDFDLYNQRAKFHERNGQKEKALEGYTRAIELSPEPEGYLYEDRARLSIEMGKFEQAVADMTAAIQWCGGTVCDFILADLFYTRATAFVGMAQYTEALLDTRRGLKIEPGNCELVELLEQIKIMKKNKRQTAD